MSDTPRTDKLANDIVWGDQEGKPVESALRLCAMLEKELAELDAKYRKINAAYSMQSERNRELEMINDGFTKCESCDGCGGHYEGSHGRLGSPVDPQTWVDCNQCDGGWVERRA